MSFTDEAWSAVEDVRKAIDGQPFLIALADGTLPRETFTYYLAQDAHYLASYARALAACAAQSPGTDELAFWAGSARRAIEVERVLHAGHVGDAAAYVRSPTCTAYTSYLLGLATAAPYPVLAAGVLPCFWVYQDVGTRLKDGVGDLSGHPYGDWIGTYGDPAFAEATEQARNLVDRAAADAGTATRQRMREAFTTATRYEWLFWDAAWRREGWPV